jgi:hypothetical protein
MKGTGRCWWLGRVVSYLLICPASIPLLEPLGFRVFLTSLSISDVFGGGGSVSNPAIVVLVSLGKHKVLPRCRRESRKFSAGRKLEFVDGPRALRTKTVGRLSSDGRAPCLYRVSWCILRAVALEGSSCPQSSGLQKYEPHQTGATANIECNRPEKDDLEGREARCAASDG